MRRFGLAALFCACACAQDFSKITVETEKQKSKAERLAQKINGVKHVVNELQVVARTKR